MSLKSSANKSLPWHTKMYYVLEKLLLIVDNSESQQKIPKDSISRACLRTEILAAQCKYTAFLTKFPRNIGKLSGFDKQLYWMSSTPINFEIVGHFSLAWFENACLCQKKRQNTRESDIFSGFYVFLNTTTWPLIIKPDVSHM